MPEYHTKICSFDERVSCGELKFSRVAFVGLTISDQFDLEKLDQSTSVLWSALPEFR